MDSVASKPTKYGHVNKLKAFKSILFAGIILIINKVGLSI